MKSFFNAEEEGISSLPRDHTHARPNRDNKFTAQYSSTSTEWIDGIQSNIWFLFDSYPLWSAPPEKTFLI